MRRCCEAAADTVVGAEAAPGRVLAILPPGAQAAQTGSSISSPAPVAQGHQAVRLDADGCRFPISIPGSVRKTLRRDIAAVELSIATPWNNGPLEGHINRLKVIKRQMYGRAGFELLKARVLPWEVSSPP